MKNSLQTPQLMVSSGSKRLLKSIGSLIFLVCLALGAKIAFRQVHSLLSSAALFELARVRVVGTHIISKKEVLALSRLKQGENVFAVDLRQIAASITENPFIKKATLSRILPNQICVRIKERKPIALVNLDRLYGVDEEAILLPYRASFPSLPIITGANVRAYQVGRAVSSPELAQAIEFLEQVNRLAPSLFDRISELRIGNPPTLFLVNGGVQVRLKQENFSQQILCLEAILKKLRTSKFTPRYIDLRFEGQIVVGT